MIDRNMMMVDSGSSRGRATRPKPPPIAPETGDIDLCSRGEALWVWPRIVRRATVSAALRPFVVAAAIDSDAPAGSAPLIISIGFPKRLLRRAAKPGCSKASTALRNALRSSSCIGAPLSIFHEVKVAEQILK